jgi:hypothetical protein
MPKVSKRRVYESSGSAFSFHGNLLLPEGSSRSLFHLSAVPGLDNSCLGFRGIRSKRINAPANPSRYPCLQYFFKTWMVGSRSPAEADSPQPSFRVQRMHSGRLTKTDPNRFRSCPLNLLRRDDPASRTGTSSSRQSSRLGPLYANRATHSSSPFSGLPEGRLEKRAPERVNEKRKPTTPTPKKARRSSGD